VIAEVPNRERAAAALEQTAESASANDAEVCHFVLLADRQAADQHAAQCLGDNHDDDPEEEKQQKHRNEHGAY
jgi:hypothetical protein